MAEFLVKSNLREERLTVGQGLRGTDMADRRGGRSDWRLWRQEHDPDGLFWVDWEMGRGKC